MESLFLELNNSKKNKPIFEYSSITEFNSHYKTYFSEDYAKRFVKYQDIDKCNNGFGNKQSKLTVMKKTIKINTEINTIRDLIQLTNNYPLSPHVTYDINIEGIHKIREYLLQLDSFIGLDELKENLIDQLIYFMYENGDDYLHTVLYGPPGTGKTEIAKLLGNIYTKLGILKKGSFLKVTRSDFVAGYLGQTAIKTRKLIEDNLGGVIFIDEAYAMGNTERQDSFSKEALDTLCELLSNHKSEIMVIIAGYREELNACFFSYNPGLISRFAWQFDIAEYSPLQLHDIFYKKVSDAGWYIADNVVNKEWFEKNMDSFKSYGRDAEQLFSKCKICYYRRIFGKKYSKKILEDVDLQNGFKKYKQFTGKKDNTKESTPNYMYT